MFVLTTSHAVYKLGDCFSRPADPTQLQTPVLQDQDETETIISFINRSKKVYHVQNNKKVNHGEGCRHVKDEEDERIRYRLCSDCTKTRWRYTYIYIYIYRH